MIPGINIIGGKASEVSNMQALRAPNNLGVWEGILSLQEGVLGAELPKLFKALKSIWIGSK